MDYNLNFVFPTEKESMNSFLNCLANSDQAEIDQAIQERCVFSKEAVSRLANAFDVLKGHLKKVSETIQSSDTLDETVKSQNKQVSDENDRMQAMVTSLQQQHQMMTLQVCQMLCQGYECSSFQLISSFFPCFLFSVFAKTFAKTLFQLFSVQFLCF